MRRFALVLGLLPLVSCQTTSDNRLASYENERQSYFQCGYSAGQRLSRRSSEPYYVVSAAKAACSSERAAMIDKIMQAHNREIWLQIIDIMDRKFREAVSVGAVSR